MIPVDEDGAFKDLVHCAGHAIRIVTYGTSSHTDCAEIECTTCGITLIEAENPEPRTEFPGERYEDYEIRIETNHLGFFRLGQLDAINTDDLFQLYGFRNVGIIGGGEHVYAYVNAPSAEQAVKNLTEMLDARSVPFTKLTPLI